MQKITSTDELQQYIRLLEIKRDKEARLIKEELNNTLESLSPANLVKKTVKNLSNSPDFKEDFMNMLLGLVTGFISKKIAIGSSDNPLKKIVGTLFQVGVTAFVSRNGNNIRSVVSNLISKFFSKKDEHTPDS